MVDVETLREPAEEGLDIGGEGGVIELPDFFEERLLPYEVLEFLLPEVVPLEGDLGEEEEEALEVLEVLALRDQNLGAALLVPLEVIPDADLGLDLVELHVELEDVFLVLRDAGILEGADLGEKAEVVGLVHGGGVPDEVDEVVDEVDGLGGELVVLAEDDLLALLRLRVVVGRAVVEVDEELDHAVLVFEERVVLVEVELDLDVLAEAVEYALVLGADLDDAVRSLRDVLGVDLEEGDELEGAELVFRAVLADGGEEPVDFLAGVDLELDVIEPLLLVDDAVVGVLATPGGVEKKL